MTTKQRQGEAIDETTNELNFEMENNKENEGDDERILTYLRIRPIKNKVELIYVEDPQTLVVRPHVRIKGVNSESRFSFTKVFGPSDSQSSVFEECIHPLLDEYFKGENCLVFSYGSTNSGKTHTMQGYGVNFGIIPRTLDSLFNRLEDCLYKKGNLKPNQMDSCVILDENMTKKSDEIKHRILKESESIKFHKSQLNSFRESMASTVGSSIFGNPLIPKHPVNHTSVCDKIQSVPVDDEAPPKSSSLYCVWISFMEIYNEKLFDLLDKTGSKDKEELKLFLNKNGQVYAKGLTECCVSSAEEAYQLFLIGKRNLRLATTGVNSRSSRSHAFFGIRMVTLKITQRGIVPEKVHRMTFCDLAGIERTRQTNNVGIRLKESGNINNSLMVLLRCIRAMRDNQNNDGNTPDVLPCRDSKLTRLFHSYLTDAKKICMLVCINPDPEMLDSTLPVLRNCAVASEIRHFRKVEFPETNSKFCRKIRESIALNDSRSIVEHETSACTTLDDSQMTRTTETETEDESDFYSAKDETSKNPNPNVETLMKENAKLRNELILVEEKTAERIGKQFDDLFAKQEDNFRKLLRETEAANENLNKRRISLAVKCMSDYSDSFSSPFNHANTTVVPSHPFPTSTPKTGLTKAAEAQETSATENATICELEKNAQIREAFIAKLQEDIKGLIQTATHSRNAVEFSNLHSVSEVTEKNVQEDVDVDMDNVGSETLDLSTQNLTDKNNGQNEKSFKEERLKLELKIHGLESDLNDALELCLECNNKLEEANAQSENLTREVNVLHQDNLRLKEEEEFLHIMITDLRTEINGLKSELQQKRGRESTDSVAVRSVKRAKRVSNSFASKRIKNEKIDVEAPAPAPRSRGRPRKAARATVKETKKEENLEESFIVTTLDENDDEEAELVPFAIRVPCRPNFPTPGKRRVTNRILTRPDYVDFSPVSLSPLRSSRSRSRTHN